MRFPCPQVASDRPRSRRPRRRGSGPAPVDAPREPLAGATWRGLRGGRGSRPAILATPAVRADGSTRPGRRKLRPRMRPGQEGLRRQSGLMESRVRGHGGPLVPGLPGDLRDRGCVISIPCRDRVALLPAGWSSRAESEPGLLRTGAGPGGNGHSTISAFLIQSSFGNSACRYAFPCASIRAWSGPLPPGAPSP